MRRGTQETRYEQGGIGHRKVGDGYISDLSFVAVA